MRRAAGIVMIGALVLGLGVGLVSGAASAQSGAPQALGLDVTPRAVAPGGTFTLTMRGCEGGQIAAGLWVPLAADPVVSTGPLTTGPAPLVATLTVPASAAPTAASVVLECSLDSTSVQVAVEILAVVPPTTAAPTVGRAPAVRSAPAFTG